MSWILKERWYWFIVIGVVLVVVVPLLLVWVILSMDPIIRVIFTVLIILAWGLVSGYKDWLVSKRKEQAKAQG
jgi:glucan phosphoethanolaminetransferase (alkaline phosphatase superfamily)